MTNESVRLARERVLRTQQDSAGFRTLLLLDWEDREAAALDATYRASVAELREAVVALADAMEP